MKKSTLILFFVSGLFLASCSTEKAPEPVYKAGDEAARKRKPTPSPPTSLSNPTNLRVTNITSTGATLNWDPVPNATSYRIMYAGVSGARDRFWIQASTSNTFLVTQPGLASGGTFEWQVAAVYSNVSPYDTRVSDFVLGPHFTLLPQ
jgi:hypothetical protein